MTDLKAVLERLKKNNLLLAVHTAENGKVRIAISARKVNTAYNVGQMYDSEAVAAAKLLREVFPQAVAFKAFGDMVVQFVIEPTEDVLDTLDALCAASQVLA